MAEKVLVTGGAGFIGSHLVDALLVRGHDVRVLDNLEPQVHGGLAEAEEWPSYLARDCEKIVADMRDKETLAKALADVSVVFHLAAMVGVGQSMYDIERYVDVNARGTAVLLDLLASEFRDQVRRLVVASSMSIYGEGAYSCPEHGQVFPKLRSMDQLKASDWEMRCPLCGQIVSPLLTNEDKPLSPTSVYAISKRDQEEMCLTVGRAYQIPTVALRYFNAYGTRQALSNPYTGVAAIFSSRLLNGNAPLIFEDGTQQRDFVHVSDIVQANLAAIESDGGDYMALNVCNGRPVTILQVAQELARALGVEIEPEFVGSFRQGDIRHCVGDPTLARETIGFRAAIPFEQGTSELIEWVSEQTAADHVKEAIGELSSRGLASRSASADN